MRKFKKIKDVNTTVKMGETEALVMRSGGVNMRLPFIKDAEQTGSYESEYGMLMVTTKTRQMTFEKNEHDGNFVVQYDLTRERATRWRIHTRISLHGGIAMNAVEQVQQSIKEALQKAILKAELTDSEGMPGIHLESPRDKANGDYATNIAMQLTKLAKKPPRAIAEAILENLETTGTDIEKIEIAGPGFMNISIRKDYLADVVKAVLEQGADYGRSNAGAGEKIQVEFVSANPTGDLHLGHARGASVGDSLCNVLDFAGYDVSREYYINDAGNQINNLAYSLEARYKQALGQDAEMPEDGYHGQDIIDIAKDMATEHGDALLQKIG